MGRLTPAQQRVFERMLHGETSCEIGRRLKISANTVRNHIKVIYAAYRVRSHPKLLVKVLGKR
jgi:DNA-binding CsgD family transcriptional regulator